MVYLRTDAIPDGKVLASFPGSQPSRTPLHRCPGSPARCRSSRRTAASPLRTATRCEAELAIARHLGDQDDLLGGRLRGRGWSGWAHNPSRSSPPSRTPFPWALGVQLGAGLRGRRQLLLYHTATRYETGPANASPQAVTRHLRDRASHARQPWRTSSTPSPCPPTVDDTNPPGLRWSVSPCNSSSFDASSRSSSDKDTDFAAANQWFWPGLVEPSMATPESWQFLTRLGESQQSRRPGMVAVASHNEAAAVAPSASEPGSADYPTPV
ncbi:uncharacterized protein LOC144165986 [Haemaphysalis longicornis]